MANQFPLEDYSAAAAGASDTPPVGQAADVSPDVAIRPRDGVNGGNKRYATGLAYRFLQGHADLPELGTHLPGPAEHTGSSVGARPVAASAGWALTGDRVAKHPGGLDLSGLLDLIEAEIEDAPDRLRWARNTCLGQVGILHPAHRARPGRSTRR